MAPLSLWLPNGNYLMRPKLFIIEKQVRVSSRTKIEIKTKWSRQSNVLVAIWQLKREKVYVSRKCSIYLWKLGL